MKVYTVKKQWVDYDGYPVGSSSTVGTYATLEKARMVMYDATGQKYALEYGFATERDGRIQWSIEELEVTE